MISVDPNIECRWWVLEMYHYDLIHHCVGVVHGCHGGYGYMYCTLTAYAITGIMMSVQFSPLVFDCWVKNLQLLSLSTSLSSAFLMIALPHKASHHDVTSSIKMSNKGNCPLLTLRRMSFPQNDMVIQQNPTWTPKRLGSCKTRLAASLEI